ncbi:MAG TPA: asparaginase domain-containing protein [Anaerolineae bacterium]|nr:asparaginase domain-containing protein [Anaerolineae bacterium]
MRICIINTGGTISCYGRPLAPMSAAEFAAASRAILTPSIIQIFPDVELYYETRLIFPESKTGTLDSTNLQPKDWCLMAKYILDHYGDYDGFVVLHGTDSMAFTGSALPFLLNVFDDNGFGTAVLSKPVIITGSQVPMYSLSSEAEGLKSLQLNFNTDAYQNFCGAVACAQLGIADIGVYFNANLYRGNRVLKINTSEFQAFNSPNYPVLAKYGINLELYAENILPGPVNYTFSLDNPEKLALAQKQLMTIFEVIDEQTIMQFNAFPAPYDAKLGTAFIADLIRACVAQNLKSLLLESYGEGNFPSGNPDNHAAGGIYQALKEADEAGVIIIDSTQVIAGVVKNSSYASGAWLAKVGAVNAFDMTAVAALTKTVILLAAGEMHGWSGETIKMLLQLNLTGEIMSMSRLDSRINNELLAGQSITSLDGTAVLVNDPRRGLRLVGGRGELLWTPFGLDSKGEPGDLKMQNSGNLVLYGDNNNPLWETGTANPEGASSVLMLCGSYGKGTLRLSVYDYSRRKETVVLYAQ